MAWSNRTRGPNKKKDITKSCIRLLREEVETGYLLCIDPSIGSSSSSCGYAVFRKGVLEECGTIEVKLSGNHSQRLHQLCQSLLLEFPKPDVLAIERIDLWKGGRSQTALVLNRVIGAVLSVWSLENVVEIPPPLWHSYTDRAAKYEKSDSNDAVMLGVCTVEICREIGEEAGDEIIGVTREPKPRAARTKKAKGKTPKMTKKKKLARRKK